MEWVGWEELGEVGGVELDVLGRGGGLVVREDESVDEVFELLVV